MDVESRLCCAQSRALNVLSRAIFNGVDSQFFALPTYRRGFGLMFQDGQLFPHRSVEGNVAYGLRGLPAAERSARVVEVLAIVGLEGFGPRSIDSLSGGQAQRVALARALAPRPRLLLLDEPLSALDRSMRESLSIELREIITGEGITSIYVTHDQDEAFTVADQIGVMIAGHLRRLDSPEAVWDDPGDMEVARFLGVEKEELELAGKESELWAVVCGTVLSRGRGFSVLPVRLESSSNAEPELMRVPFGHPIPSLWSESSGPGISGDNPLGFTRDQSLSTRDRFLWCCSPKLPARGDRYDSCGGEGLGNHHCGCRCGYGKTDRGASWRGAKVIAVEPAQAMREQLVKLLGHDRNLQLVDACAEATGLKDASVDRAVFAQSWHWVDPQVAGRKCTELCVPVGS